jgi:hypothetical protein
MSKTTDKSKKTVTRAKPKFVLPDPSASFEKHLELLKAYVVLSKSGKESVTYRSFKGYIDLSPFVISSNNAFLKQIGIIEEVEKQRGAYLPTESAIRLYNALKWEKNIEIQSILGDLLKTSWFWSFAKHLLELKGKVSRTELKEKLGFEANADPKKHIVSLNVLVDYLLKAGLIVEQDGNLTLKPNQEQGAVSESSHIEVLSAIQSIPGEKSEVLSRDSIKQPTTILIGIFLTPEMSEEQIRKTIRIVLSELKGDTQ